MQSTSEDDYDSHPIKENLLSPIKNSKLQAESDSSSSHSSPPPLILLDN
jgi:hypothetical protein